MFDVLLHSVVLLHHRGRVADYIPNCSKHSRDTRSLLRITVETESYSIDCTMLNSVAGWHCRSLLSAYDSTLQYIKVFSMSHILMACHVAAQRGKYSINYLMLVLVLVIAIVNVIASVMVIVKVF